MQICTAEKFKMIRDHGWNYCKTLNFVTSLGGIKSQLTSEDNDRFLEFSSM